MASFSHSDLEGALAATLERHLRGPDFQSYQGTPPNLAESIRYSLLAPGKRIRPRLTLACAEMTLLGAEAALPAALAIEMIHCFTLIHDDLPCMDDDDFRRGRPSNHKAYGEGMALLAGDALMALGWETLLGAAGHVEPGAMRRALARFAWAVGPRGVIGGQAAEALLDSNSSLAELQQMHAMKTGALFSASLLVPMDLASVDQASPKGRTLESFAAELGLAFQVADDLEDAGTEAGNPLNILHYVTREEARHDASDRLKKATFALEEAWGTRAAEPLTTISSEVQRAL